LTRAQNYTFLCSSDELATIDIIASYYRVRISKSEVKVAWCFSRAADLTEEKSAILRINLIPLEGAQLDVFRHDARKPDARR
jgi:hypothetical protein